MRFAGARAEGLDERVVDAVVDGYEESGLAVAEVAALKLTDALIGIPRNLTESEKSVLRENFTDAQITELALGVGLFLALSKALIALGLEPESMPVSVLPSPGQPPAE